MALFETLIASLTGTDDTPEPSTRRKHTRRNCDKCVGEIDGQNFPVENWSMGGALVYADSRLFSMDQEVDITLKFKLRDTILDVAHRARIVRRGFNQIGVEFLPLSRKIQNAFQNVIDDHMAQEFAQSQSI